MNCVMQRGVRWGSCCAVWQMCNLFMATQTRCQEHRRKRGARQGESQVAIHRYVSIHYSRRSGCNEATNKNKQAVTTTPASKARQASTTPKKGQQTTNVEA
eukprot:1014283-Amphidinium_carterae.6